MSDARHRSVTEIWRWPAALAVLTICGLLCALLGQTGAWLVLSWLALALPLLLIVRNLCRAQFQGLHRWFADLM
jgi:hypothetical protein